MGAHLTSPHGTPPSHPPYDTWQVERVLDLMDINFLRGVADWHIDINFKTLVWNLSQARPRSHMASSHMASSHALMTVLMTRLCIALHSAPILSSPDLSA